MPFTIDGTDYEVKLPRGRQGRKATNYLIKKFSGENVDMEAIIDVLDDSEFESKYLPAILGVEPSVVEEGGTTAEILNALMAVVVELFAAFETPEVEEATKN